jgi:DNA-binding MarR family transcriptional regulator/GNAT superfamily N-acetyltransferase
VPGIASDWVHAVRAFNRFWTKQIGILGTSILETRYSLTEARVLFELAQKEVVEVADLRSWLDLDAGYLSRILAQFRTSKLITTEASEADGRRQLVRLTARGRKTLDGLNARSSEQVRSMLAGLSENDQRRLVEAMSSIRQILESSARSTSCTLRSLGPGDLDWVVRQHALLTGQEARADEQAEGQLIRTLADLVERRDPRKGGGWIAELDHAAVGCVFCVSENAQVARIRFLLVRPEARDWGVASRLLEECVGFARGAGYGRLVLQMPQLPDELRTVCERAGFALVREADAGREPAGRELSLALT